jgi:hypothetical protein
MPGRNGMGPMGAGPMTGRGMGRCGGADGRTDLLPPREPGFGMGRGGGRGNRWRRGQMGCRGPAVGHAPAPAGEEELAALKAQVACLDRASEELRTRIAGREAHEAASLGKDTR